MDIKLIAIDIDGTLLNEKNELAQPTIDAITAARKKRCQNCLVYRPPVKWRSAIFGQAQN